MSKPMQFHPLEFNPKSGEPFLRLPAPHENIIITPPRMSDAPAVVSNMADPAIYTFLEGPPFPYLPEHADQWLTKIKNGTDAAFEVLKRANEEKPDEPPVLLEEPPVRTIREIREDGSELFLGDILFVRERYPDIDDKEVKKTLAQPNADRTLGDPEIVWCIGDYLASSHHGKGIMTAAIRTFIRDWAVPRMGARRIRVETFADNIGSRRVFEKLGFTYEKTVPVQKILNSGRTVDGMDILWWKAE
ncbi:acyl-CoA N-acyltransferase [Dichomitus squalens]|uniref:Acyl-CoA N-acyltransferase n=1 Tax=Dichomitus squalens TaxID=114155 RepID=A0A4Q9N4C3_9APHY|nr:acyl-CoA N-acyltransferase [Dichomitus squalens]